MDFVKVTATPRKTSGKNEARRLRASGSIPAIAYGKGEPALALTVSPKAVSNVFTHPLGRNSVIELDIEGSETLTVLLTDYQYHPVRASCSTPTS